MKRSKNILKNLAVSTLPFFTVILMGPAEIYFGNIMEFDFLFTEFIYPLAVIFLIAAAVLTAALSLLPDKLQRLCRILVFAGSLGGYIQVMFLNKDLDILGLDPAGYHPAVSKVLTNLLIWLAILAVLVILYIKKRDWCDVVAVAGSVFLLLIQLTGFISMPLTGPEKAFSRPEDGLFLSGEDQFTVSADSNIIIIILDYYSNTYVDEMLEDYPDGVDALHDFTCYTNADSTYFGTYPSLNHMLTGYEYDPTISVEDWCRDCWTNEQTERFYDELHEAGYILNLYTQPVSICDGGNGCGLLTGKVSNLSDDYSAIHADTEQIVKIMGKMSCYRFAPVLLKSQFFANFSEYTGLVVYGDTILRFENSDFFTRLQEGGLKTDDSTNRVIVQHLAGAHDYTTNIDGTATPATYRNNTCRGCIAVVEEYLDQLRAVGAYDDSMIIVTSDHGDDHENYMQIIEYVKMPGETHDVSPVNPAPISHNDLPATIAYAAGIKDYNAYGRTIFDIEPDEERERTLSFRRHDDNYPEIKNYTNGNAGSNVFYYFTYTGDRHKLDETYLDGPDKIVPLFDTYY